MTKEPFVGIFPEYSVDQVSPASYKFRALRDLFESAPGFRRTAILGMRLGGERDHNEVLYIGKPFGQGKTDIFRRRVDNVSYHGIAVALAANSLSDATGFTPSERNMLVTAAGLHDSSKVIELEMMGYRELSQELDSQGRIANTDRLPLGRQILQETLTTTRVLEGAIPFNQIIKELEVLDATAFTAYFDKNINPLFLRNVLSTSGEFSDPKMVEDMITIASADSVGQIPALIARATYFAGEMGLSDEATRRNSDLARYIKEKGLLPEILGDEKVHLMALALLYCDGISQGDRIRTIDDRIDEAVQRGQYKDLDEEAKSIYGISFFEANRIAMHGAERVLMDFAVKKSFVSTNTPPEDLPRYIFENILKRADARIA